jgi:DNA polymerase III epsilon subunit-like protein
MGCHLAFALMCCRGLPAKPALRVLASRHLRRNIQDGQHDSIVDARAAMDLALLKIQNSKQ